MIIDEQVDGFVILNNYLFNYRDGYINVVPPNVHRIKSIQSENVSSAATTPNLSRNKSIADIIPIIINKPPDVFAIVSEL